MDVGNDPFPRDEVTGLAAFENLEPVSALNVMPEETTPALPPAPPAPPGAARTFTRPIGVAPTTAVDDASRPDNTDVMTLEKLEPVQDGAALGWDEDEATEFFSPTNFKASPPPTPADALPRQAPPAASLQMDWDEEEPPTRMRDDSMAFLPPLPGASASPGIGGSWSDDMASDQAGRYDDLATAGYAPVDVPVPSPPVGRPSPFPPPGGAPNYLAPIPTPAAERGGAPSPFSATSTDLPQTFPMASRPPWVLVAAGAAVAVLLLLIGRWIFGGPSTADVTIATTPTDARVYVDGRPVSGTSSPFTANELSEGPHELLVQKDGFAEHRSTFSVEAGESRALAAVELVSKAKDTGFAINSVPSGASISIDGNTTGQVTPAKLTGIAPGVHKLKLELDGHNGFELQVLVPESGVLQLPTAELVANGGSRRAEAREAREAREPREPREPRESSLASDSASKRRKVAEEPEPRAERVERAEPAPRSSGGGSTGMLRLNSRPWSQVYVDGKLVGNTPQMGLPLSPGNHSIRLVNAQMGLTKTFNVSIKTGQMVTKVVNLVE